MVHNGQIINYEELNHARTSGVSAHGIEGASI